ncbi:hypothetical protein ACFCZ1_16920 [Streptomyces sp. NPDC056224]|uniref:hypothetical protein n=1 Tax=Streptomyces sp. NPDC056224 TaxID=3345750 RepID=UPI0035D67DE9
MQSLLCAEDGLVRVGAVFLGALGCLSPGEVAAFGELGEGGCGVAVGEADGVAFKAYSWSP